MMYHEYRSEVEKIADQARELESGRSIFVYKAVESHKFVQTPRLAYAVLQHSDYCTHVMKHMGKEVLDSAKSFEGAAQSIALHAMFGDVVNCDLFPDERGLECVM